MAGKPTAHLQRQLRQRKLTNIIDSKAKYSRQEFRDKAKLLENWFIEHKKFPYPSYAEKLALADQGCMSVEQVSNWFANTRRRLKMASAAHVEQSTEQLKEPENFVLEVQTLQSRSETHGTAREANEHSNSANNNDIHASPRKYKSTILMRYLTENNASGS